MAPPGIVGVRGPCRKKPLEAILINDGSEEKERGRRREVRPDSETGTGREDESERPRKQRSLNLEP